MGSKKIRLNSISLYGFIAFAFIGMILIFYVGELQSNISSLNHQLHTLKKSQETALSKDDLDS